MRKFSVKQLTLAAATGALYAAMTLMSSVFGIAYGPVQFRLSEALCVLPFLFPETSWGLFVGCWVANLISPYGPLDMVVGSLATLIAALWTARCRCKWLAPLPPVLCNGILIGAVIAWQQAGSGSAFWAAFAWNGFTVALGEAVVCYLLGLLLLRLLPRIPFFRERMRLPN
ncbi:MAG: QueT transporter family protein [Ruminococcaceae bacterium]|nr:QueT transporter family protein [Oscillospiraceae bacterium]